MRDICGGLNLEHFSLLVHIDIYLFVSSSICIYYIYILINLLCMSGVNRKKMSGWPQ